jgi:hypothetical protein
MGKKTRHPAVVAQFESSLFSISKTAIKGTGQARV